MRKTRIGMFSAVALSVAAMSAPAAAQQGNSQLKQTPDTGVDQPSAARTAPPATGQRNTNGVTIVRRPNGVVMALLDETFEDALVATKNADGSITYTCLHGLPAAAKHVAGAPKLPVTTAPVLEEK